VLLNTYPCFQFIVKSHAIQKWSGNQISSHSPSPRQSRGWGTGRAHSWSADLQGCEEMPCIDASSESEWTHSLNQESWTWGKNKQSPLLLIFLLPLSPSSSSPSFSSSLSPSSSSSFLTFLLLPSPPPPHLPSSPIRRSTSCLVFTASEVAWSSLPRLLQARMIDLGKNSDPLWTANSYYIRVFIQCVDNKQTNKQTNKQINKQMLLVLHVLLCGYLWESGSVNLDTRLHCRTKAQGTGECFFLLPLPLLPWEQTWTISSAMFSPSLSPSVHSTRCWQPRISCSSVR